MYSSQIAYVYHPHLRDDETEDEKLIELSVSEGNIVHVLIGAVHQLMLVIGVHL